MPDIEFLPESADADDADEELSAAARRRSLRWMGGAVFAAVVLAAAIVAATRGGDSPTSPPAPSTPSIARSTAVADPVSGLKPVFLGEFSGEPVLAITVLGRSVWVLQSDGLHVVLPAGRRDILQVPAGLQDVQLVPDQGARIVWLVAKGLAQAYNANVSAVIGARVPAFTDVTALDGRLYVISGNALLEVGPRQPVARQVMSGRIPLAALAADPTRHRLIVASQSTPTQVWAVTPSHQGRAQVQRPAHVRVVKPSLHVAHGAIWLAGFDAGGGVLMRLDARSLDPVVHSSLDPILEPGAILVGSGTESLWLRDGNGSNMLRCIDPATGDELQSWEVSGHVASTVGHAVVGTTYGGVYLDLRNCPG